MQSTSADLERGANWIHGTDQNPILDLATETGTVCCSSGEKSLVFDEHGEILPEPKATQMSDLFWGMIADAFKHSNECPNIPSSKSLKDFIVEKLEEKDLTTNDKALMVQIADIWGAFVGEPVDRQSLKYFWLEECIDGGTC